jgi:PAS domain S-box-containing protein
MNEASLWTLLADKQDEVPGIERSFRRLFDHAPVAMALVGLDLRIRVVNAETGRMLGYHPDELAQLHIERIVHPSDLEMVSSKIERLVTGEVDQVVADTRQLCKDGEIVLGRASIRVIRDGDGRPLFVLPVVVDITDLDRTEAALRRNEARLDSIFRASPAGIGVVVDRVFTEVNDRVCQMLGYSREELIGQSARIVYSSDEEFERVGREKYARLRADGVGTVETRWQHRDGHLVDVLLSSADVDPADPAQGTAFTALDIGQRKRAEESSIRLEEQVRHAQKMEAMGALAGGIAHDFGNHLTGILAYSSWLKLEADAGGHLFEAADVIERTARKAFELTRKLLDFSRRASVQVEQVDLHEVVSDVVSILARTIDKRIDIRSRAEADAAAVAGDANQLEQLVMNLAVNARDAMPDGGELVLATRTVDADRRLRSAHPELAPGRLLVLEVSDSGCGMSEAVVERAFEPFFTTKEKGEGTGMGLAMAYSIVTGHKGAVEIDSEVGRGTTVSVYLPLADAGPASDEDPARDQPVRGSGRILVVDDEETVRSALRRILSSFGYTVVMASNGQEAVEYFRGHVSEIDLVILDLTMPVMDGRACFNQLLEIDSRVRVLLASAHGIDAAAEGFPVDRLRGRIQKPFAAAELSAAVADALAEDDGSGE